MTTTASFHNLRAWILALIFCSIQLTAQAQIYNGDMNHDGTIDIGDVQTLANVALGNIAKEELNIEGEPQPLRILSIGHSFTESAFAYLPEIVAADGCDVSNIALYRIVMGSSGFDEFLNIFRGKNDKKYLCDKVLGDIDIPQINAQVSTNVMATNANLIRKVLNSTKWDMIVISQVSSESEDATKWDANNALGAYLDTLKSYQPDAEFVYYIPYASFARAKTKGKTTEQLSQLISTASKYLADKYGLRKIVPCATAIENLRKTKYNDTTHWMSDMEDHHLTYGLARYTAGCIFYQSVLAPVFGHSVLGNKYRKNCTAEEKAKYSNSLDVNEETAKYGQMAAYLAENFWNIVINPTPYVDYKEY